MLINIGKITRELRRRDGRTQEALASALGVCVDECGALAREGMVEFPGNEKLVLCLASMLYNAGYVRREEHHLTDSEGYDIYDSERHKTYIEWQEAIKLYESLTNSAVPAIRSRAAVELSQLYLNVGEHEKAAALAESAPEYTNCRELLRMMSRDGVERAEVLGENLLLWIQTAARFMISGVVLNKSVLTAHESAEVP